VGLVIFFTQFFLPRHFFQKNKKKIYCSKCHYTTSKKKPPGKIFTQFTKITPWNKTGHFWNWTRTHLCYFHSILHGIFILPIIIKKYIFLLCIKW